ncbi:MAG: outer membrane lipoprotein-sorting protein [Myxococcota bacterium]
MVTLLLALFASPAQAETPDEVIAKAREANRVESSIQTIRMTIASKSGSERVREVELKSRREGDVVKSYMRITSPADIAGTQLLLVDNPGKSDQQMLYLPAYKRVNFISGAGRKGSFVGSDFSFEDFEIREAAGGTHKITSDTAEAWVVETTLTDSDTSYTKISATIGKADLVVKKVEFYDATGLLKVLEVTKTAKDGAVTLPIETTMTNVQKGTKTKLEIVAHKLNVPKTELPDDTFTQAYLERGG